MVTKADLSFQERYANPGKVSHSKVPLLGNELKIPLGHFCLRVL